MLASFMSANFALVVGQAIAGLFIARLINPSDMGIYVTSTIILTYIPILLLGIGNGLNRNLPFVIGQGHLEEAKKQRDTAISWALVSSSFIFLIILCVSAYFYQANNLKLAMAFLSTAVTGALLPMISIKEVTYRTSEDFIQLSKIKFIFLGLIIISLVLVYFWGYSGMLLRIALITFLYVLLLFYFSNHSFKFTINKSAFLSLLKTGLPIYIVAYLYSIYLGLDKILIAKYFGTDAMGLYVPAIHVGTALAIIPTSIFQIIYPRMALRYGETGTIKSLKKLAFTPLIYLAFGLIPIFLVAAWLVKPFVEIVLPEYIEGIAAARWMILVYYFKCLGGPQDILTIIGDLKPYGILTIFCAIVFFFLFLILKSKGMSIQAVPISLAFSILIFNVLISIYVLKLMREETF